MKTMEEEILCFDREILSSYSGREKVFWDPFLWKRILDNLENFPRATVENDYRYKQLVAYVVVKTDELYLTYKRTKKGAEKRLSEKYSIGIGGHINVDDKSQLTLTDSHQERDMNLFLQAVRREIGEEINLKSRGLEEPELLCFINDDSDEVGKLHFGIVWILKIETPDVSGGKRGVSELRFYDIHSLKARKRRFERWSQLLIDYFAKGDL